MINMLLSPHASGLLLRGHASLLCPHHPVGPSAGSPFETPPESSPTILPNESGST